MGNPVTEYHRGEMDIHEQTSTYAFVMNMTKWGSLAIAVGVLFLVLNFCTATGFLGAAIVAIVALVVGILVLRGGGGH